MRRGNGERHRYEIPGLTYTRDLQNWSDFIRRTPGEYEAWIKQVTKECTVLELKILEELSNQNKPVFVDLMSIFSSCALLLSVLLFPPSWHIRL